jgi:hypothetical protein
MQADSPLSKTTAAIPRNIFQVDEVPEESPQEDKLLSVINGVLMGVFLLTLVALAIVIRKHAMRAKRSGRSRRRRSRSSSIERSVDA